MSAIAVATLERRVAQLEAEVAGYQAALMERPDFTRFVFRLTGHEGRLLACLVKRGRASREQLMIAMLGPQYASARDWKQVDVRVCKIRQKLASYGLSIETEHGYGYSMTEDDRAKVRTIMGEREGQ